MGCATVRLQRRGGRRRMTPVGSLKGRRIVVTRAREQAGDLVRALQEHGAEAVIVPVIRIQPLDNLGALRAALTGLSAYRWVVFTSQNAVQIVFDRLVAWGLTPRVFSSTSVAAIGTATADALTVRGVVPALVPAEFVAEALAEDLIQRSGGTLTGARVLIPSAEDAREALATGLRQHGATVENIAVYRTVPVQADLSGLATDITRGRVDAVTFTSSSTVRSFVDLVGRPAATSRRPSVQSRRIPRGNWASARSSKPSRTRFPVSWSRSRGGSDEARHARQPTGAVAGGMGAGPPRHSGGGRSRGDRGHQDAGRRGSGPAAPRARGKGVFHQGNRGGSARQPHRRRRALAQGSAHYVAPGFGAGRDPGATRSPRGPRQRPVAVRSPCRRAARYLQPQAHRPGPVSAAGSRGRPPARQRAHASPQSGNTRRPGRGAARDCRARAIGSGRQRLGDRSARRDAGTGA